jgi:hypothetical protein
MTVDELIQLMRTTPLHKVRAALEELAKQKPAKYQELVNLWLYAHAKK